MLAVNAEGQVQPPSGGPTEEILGCKFCLSEFGSDPVEGLLCGHVFHTDCINRYMEITCKPKAECCPYKCHHSMVVQVPVQDDTQTMDVDDHPVADTNADADQQAASEDEEGALAAAIW